MKKRFLCLAALLGAQWISAAENQKHIVLPSAYSIAWSNNGQRYLAKMGPTLYKVFNENGQEIWSRTMVAGNVVLSPDGSQLAYVVHQDGLYVHTFQSHDEERLVNISGTDNIVTQVTWSPTGQKLAYWIIKNGSANDTSGELIVINPNKSN